LVSRDDRPAADDARITWLVDRWLRIHRWIVAQGGVTAVSYQVPDRLEESETAAIPSVRSVDRGISDRVVAADH
jgi:hypothetical protein